MIEIGTIVKINPSYALSCDLEKYFMVIGFPYGKSIILKYIDNDMSLSDPYRRHSIDHAIEIPYGKTQPLLTRPFSIADNHMGIFNLCFATLKCGLDSLYVYDHVTGIIQKNADKLNLFADKSYFVLDTEKFEKHAKRFNVKFNLYDSCQVYIDELSYDAITLTEIAQIRMALLGKGMTLDTDGRRVFADVSSEELPCEITLEELETMKIYKSMAQ